MWKVGAILKQGYNDLAKKHRLEDFTECIGYPCRTVVAFYGQGKFDENEMKSYMQQELFRRGLLWASFHALSFSHKEEDITKALAAFDESLELLSKAIHGGKNIRSLLQGEPVKPVFRKVADFLSYTVKKS